MIRKIIHIDEEKCNGCGACASACQEGAIAMVDGKARLMRDLRQCLPRGSYRYCGWKSAASAG